MDLKTIITGIVPGPNTWMMGRTAIQIIRCEVIDTTDPDVDDSLYDHHTIVLSFYPDMTIIDQSSSRNSDESIAFFIHPPHTNGWLKLPTYLALYL